MFFPGHRGGQCATVHRYPLGMDGGLVFNLLLVVFFILVAVLAIAQQAATRSKEVQQ